ncbi:trypsin-like peptidase domain-containing protein [Streptomyces sp. NPDC048197]|uniref:trypsin-like peptidase domain-containing protein n=1 Tax=Streptomyces sp. NPDC048197 TaxID=3365511 RepID=UPI003711B495
MDDGKAAGPKLKWWSRPGNPPNPERSAEAGHPAGPSGAGEQSGRSGLPGTSGGSGDTAVQEPEDWIVRPPERPAGAQATGAGAGGTLAAPPAEHPDSADELTSAASAASAATGQAQAQDRTGAEAAGPAGLAVPAEATEVTAPAPPAGAPSGAATVTLGQVPPAAAPERAQAPGAPESAQAPTGAASHASAPAPAVPSVSAETPSTPPQRRPLHAEDPYGTPPYGGPGPWAPAPPVQRPVTTPAHGTVLPPSAGPMPPYGAPAAPAAQAAPGAGYPGTPPSPHPAAPPAAALGDQPHPAAPDGTGPAQPAPSAAPSAAPSVGPAAGQAAPPGAETGAPVQPDAAAMPPGPAPAHEHPGAPHGAWQQYDPWRAPLQGGGPLPPPAARRTPRGVLVAGAVALALLAGGVGGGIGAYVERYGGINDIKLPQAAGDSGGRKPDSVAGIARAALPGVVTIHVRGNAEQGTGTGFVLDREGHILTNNHVVEPAGTGGEISVTFSGGQTAKAKIVGQDGGYDLAVVQVEGVTGLRPLPLGNSDSVQVGDPVVAIGAPFDLANTVTAGIISAKQRPITAGGQKGDGSDISYVDALQTDAPINPGNSGGPLVDARARVIGINSAIRAADSGGGSDGGGQGGSIGLGFAIPINQAKRVAEELINTGRATHPVIGVTLEMEYAGDGARVSAHSKGGKPPVVPGGPGAKAGIRAGDVITAVDGAPVHSGEELIVKIRSHRPGDTLALTLQRDGKERSVRLRLGSSTAG